MNQRLIARITGWTIVIMALAAGFVFGYAIPDFSSPQPGDQLQIHIQSNRGLYLAMLVGIIFIQILDVIASFTFYKFFQEDPNKFHSYLNVLPEFNSNHPGVVYMNKPIA